MDTKLGIKKAITVLQSSIAFGRAALNLLPLKNKAECSDPFYGIYIQSCLAQLPSDNSVPYVGFAISRLLSQIFS